MKLLTVLVVTVAAAVNCKEEQVPLGPAEMAQ